MGIKIIILTLMLMTNGSMTWSQEVCNPSHAVILIYHHVSEGTPASTSVTPKVFEEHLNYLEQNGFRVMDLPWVVNRLKSGEAVPDSVVVITFDDGYRSVYEEAFPLLKKRQWPFTVFVCPEVIDHQEGPVLSWGQLREMQAAGAVVASHGLNHSFMNRTRPQESIEHLGKRLELEFVKANKRLADEHLKVHPLLAYPYGEYSAEVQAVVRRLGWTALGQHSGVVGPKSDFTCLPRYPMAAGFASLDDFGIKVSSLPMPLLTVANMDPNLSFENDFPKAPVLELSIDLNCLNPALMSAFASGQGAITCRWSEKQKGVLQIQAPNALPLGRSRYNVTAPVPRTGRWYWFSQNWINGTDHQH